MSGTELFATFLGSVALLLWGVRMVRTGMTRAFGARLRRMRRDLRPSDRAHSFAGLGVTGAAAELDRDRAAARLLRGARPDRARRSRSR